MRDGGRLADMEKKIWARARGRERESQRLKRGKEEGEQARGLGGPIIGRACRGGCLAGVLPGRAYIEMESGPWNKTTHPR